MQYRPLGRTGVQVSPLCLIDQFVAPGVTLNPDDDSYGDQELKPSARRR